MSIAERVVYIQQHEGYTASKFAEKLGVQRSGLSHLYSGRNNPSIDFIQKLIDNFPQYRAEWIINGKEPIKHVSDAIDMANTVKTNFKNEDTDLFSTLQSEDKAEYKSKKLERNNDEHKNKISPIPDSELEKIILVYKNGTFETLLPKN